MEGRDFAEGMSNCIIIYPIFLQTFVLTLFLF